MGLIKLLKILCFDLLSCRDLQSCHDCQSRHIALVFTASENRCVFFEANASSGNPEQDILLHYKPLQQIYDARIILHWDLIKHLSHLTSNRHKCFAQHTVRNHTEDKSHYLWIWKLQSLKNRSRFVVYSLSGLSPRNIQSSYQMWLLSTPNWTENQHLVTWRFLKDISNTNHCSRKSGIP